MSDGTAKAQVEHVILAPDVLCENAATLVRPHERARLVVFATDQPEYEPLPAAVSPAAW
jgi:hypothetical protein